MLFHAAQIPSRTMAIGKQNSDLFCTLLERRSGRLCILSRYDLSFVAQTCGGRFSNISTVRLVFVERCFFCGSICPDFETQVALFLITLCTYTVQFESLWAKASEVVVRGGKGTK